MIEASSKLTSPHFRPFNVSTTCFFKSGETLLVPPLMLTSLAERSHRSPSYHENQTVCVVAALRGQHIHDQNLLHP